MKGHYSHRRLKRPSIRSIVTRCLNDPEFRAQATRESHVLFFLVYLSEHLQYPLAPFHKKILKLTDKTFGFLVVAAFRGAGKSTICTVSLALWLVLGKRQKKCILIVARTQQLARQIIDNIIRIIETAERLKRDLWPVGYDADETRRFSIEFKKFGAKIIAVSLDQNVRGINFGLVRPDAVICDDLEDSDAARTQESRDDLHRRFVQEFLPLGDLGTDIVVVGNTVHEDCLVLRLGSAVLTGERRGHFIRVPIAAEGRPTWPGKFKSMNMIEDLWRTIGDEIVWRTEYMLDPRMDTASLVQWEWFLPWDTLPAAEHKQWHQRVIGVDMAFSQEKNADYTAIVCADLYWKKDSFELYIAPEFVNDRFSPEGVFRRVDEFARAASAGRKEAVHIFTEDMGAHRLYVEQWKKAGWQANAVPLRGMSKEQRMVTPAQFIQRGTIRFFPRGLDLLKRQIVGIGGIASHDDLADAFSIMVHGVLGLQRPSQVSAAEWLEANRELGRRARRRRRDSTSILDMRF